MGASFLHQNLLPAFLDLLLPWGVLHGPTLTDQGVTVFAPLSAPYRLALDYRRTLIPPKKYLLPFREKIAAYRNGLYQTPSLAPSNRLLFGVHPCDLRAIAYLDRVFLGDPPDPCYARRREQLTLVGISCEPDEHCFCDKEEPPCCDLFLDRVADGFLVTVRSARGGDIVRDAAGVLSRTDREPPPAARGATAPVVQDPARRFASNPLWDRYARECVSCGACSACCPTCYCFDVREYPALEEGGERIREWDNCLFKKHGEVAGGNFRSTRLERLRYRFLHKYFGFSPLEGIVSCVGCGRCLEVCPVGIDLRNLTEPALPFLSSAEKTEGS